MKLLVVVAATLAASAADVDESAFRYTRTLEATTGAAVRFEPDKRMYGHARPDFPDLRILDARGEEVPWRSEPKPDTVPRQSLPLVARGRLGDVVSVVADRGPAPPIIDRLELAIPDRTFVGSVFVLGSATGAEGSYATLSRTPIYSVRGAVDARSTTAVFAPSDYRFLLLQVRGVSRLSGVHAFRDPFQPPLEPVEAPSTKREEGRATVVELDLGHPGVPVDRIRILATTPRYIRPVHVEGSDDGSTWVSLGYREQVAHFPGVDLSNVALAARRRFLRVTIQNGDDEPLAGLQVVPEALPRRLLLAGGYEPPYRILYGAAAMPEPTYDFRRLPAGATGFEEAVEGSLGAEGANPLFEASESTETFFERNDFLIQGLLVVAALVVAAGGVVALRRRV
jgi:hypothetical protein